MFRGFNLPSLPTYLPLCIGRAYMRTSAIRLRWHAGARLQVRARAHAGAERTGKNEDSRACVNQRGMFEGAKSRSF